MSRVEPPAGSEDVCCPGERQLPPTPFRHPPPTTPILPPPPRPLPPCLLHLRPSTHPSTYSTTPFYRDVPRDGQLRLTVESVLQTRSPLCIVHINATVLVLVNAVLFVNHYHPFSLLPLMPTLLTPPPLLPLRPHTLAPAAAAAATATAAATAAPHPTPSRHVSRLHTFHEYSPASLNEPRV